MEKYSVLMSLYIKEKPEYLRLSIDSMLHQTIPPDEITIVRDGMLTPELNYILEEYKKSYPELFNIVGYNENKGLGPALNYGLEYCKNELVARMDTDDIAVPDRCERQLEAFEKDNKLEIIGGDIAEFIDNPDNIVAYRRVPVTDSEIKNYMKFRCPFNHMTVMFKKSSVLRAGNYQSWFWNEDYYLWIRMLEQGCVFANTGNVLVKMRSGLEMYARRGGKKYFVSEIKLQKYMLKKHIIGVPTYIANVLKRWIVQVLLPDKVRGWAYKRFARNKD